MSLHAIDESTQKLTHLESANKSLKIANYIWDVNSLSWVKQSASGGGTGSEVVVTNFPAVFPISDNGGSITVDGTVSVTGIGPASSNTTANITISTSPQTLLSINASRKGATIFNNSDTATTYVNFGNTVSNTDFIVAMAPKSYYEVPFGFTGKIVAVSSVASGFLTVSEMT